jgi:hypothetical protein
MIEFVCENCGVVIMMLADRPPEDGMCFTCSFLEANVPDPAEREAIRKRLDHEE